MKTTENTDATDLNQDTFCVLPWTHLYFDPEGKVYACCQKQPFTEPLGDLNEESVRDVWLNNQTKQLRRDFLAGKRNENVCAACYKMDDSGGLSMRKLHNRKFLENQIRTPVDLKSSTPPVNLKLWDIRFSNLCNYRCRTCSPTYSSAWYKDAEVVHEEIPKLLSPEKQQELLQFYLNQSPSVEKIYFAGGEPLLMEEHYQIVKHLEKQGFFDVELSYNSNGSVLSYKGTSFIDIWRKFPHVFFCVSIDHVGKKAEFIRKGSNWGQVLQNIQAVRKFASHVHVRPSITVSNLNVLDLAMIIEELIDENVIAPTPDCFNINIVYGPRWYRVSAMPSMLRSKARERLESFQARIKQKYNVELTQLNVVHQALEKDDSEYIHEFLSITEKLDKARGEDFFALFPEMNGMKQI